MSGLLYNISVLERQMLFRFSTFVGLEKIQNEVTTFFVGLIPGTIAKHTEKK